MGPAIGKTEKTRGTDLSPNLQCAFQWNWICMFQSLEIFQFKRAIFWIRLFIKVWTNKSLNCRRPKIDGCPGEIWDRPKVNIGPERFGRREERFSGKANKRKRWEDSGHLKPNALWLQLIPQTWSKWCSKCDHFLTSASARPPGLLLIGAVRLSQSKQWKYQLQTHLSSYLSLSLGSPEYRQEKNAKFFFWKRQFLKKNSQRDSRCSPPASLHSAPNDKLSPKRSHSSQFCFREKPQKSGHFGWPLSFS